LSILLRARTVPIDSRICSRTIGRCRGYFHLSLARAPGFEEMAEIQT